MSSDEFDFEGRLVEAEACLEVIRQDRDRLRTLWRFEAGLTAATFVALIVATAGGIGTGSADREWLLWIAIAVASLACAAVLRLGADRRRRRHIAAREQDSLEEVDRLREILVHVAHQQRWDDARVDATRRRLSQFPIEVERFRWP